MTDDPYHRNPLLDLLNPQNPVIDPTANERYTLIFDKLLALQESVRTEIENLNGSIRLLTIVRLECPAYICLNPDNPYDRKNFSPENCKVANGLNHDCRTLTRTFPVQLDIAIGDKSSNTKEILDKFRALLLKRHEELEDERKSANLMIQMVLKGIALR